MPVGVARVLITPRDPFIRGAGAKAQANPESIPPPGTALRGPRASVPALDAWPRPISAVLHHRHALALRGRPASSAGTVASSLR